MDRVAQQISSENLFPSAKDSICRPAGEDEAKWFLGLLADPAREEIDARHVALVVAHPDDEAVGAGGQLGRLAGVTLIHVTDGAPRHSDDARNRGFQSCEDYAAARRRELERAAALANIAPDALLSLGIPDQQALYCLAELAGRLADLIVTRGIRLILTHPYEGGHPDHDATAFAVHAACSLLKRRGLTPPGLIEMAFYFAGEEHCIHQRFPPNSGGDELVLTLDKSGQALKRGMLDAHATQAGSLWVFTDAEERFRPAPAYDFRQLPNGGRLNYERFGWGLMGATWLELFRRP